MLRRMRASPAARAALAVAGALAVAAAFGLHPEPPGADRVAAHRGLSGAHQDDAPHACPACLTHAAALVAPRAQPIAPDPAADRNPRSPEASSLSRRAALHLFGRAPPARS